MENPNTSTLNRVEKIPDAKIMHFARQAQRRKVANITGFELKNKNLTRFRRAIADLYDKGDPHATKFVNNFSLQDGLDELSGSSMVPRDPETSLFEMATELDAHREQLLDTMKDLVDTVQSQAKELHALRLHSKEVEAELVDIKTQGAKKDSLNPEYINYLSELLREVRILQNGAFLNKGDQ